MNVGLMTCYINNYGACLQAYALQQAIVSGKHNCEIIRYTPYADLKKKFNLNTVTETNSVKIKRAIRHPIQFLARKKDRKNQALRDAKFEKFRTDNLIFSQREYYSWNELNQCADLYDAYVCGSDQIWNPVIHHNSNVGPYFLDFAPDDKCKIAYAPSIGIQVVPDECKEDMRRLIRRIDAVSIRELHGAELINEIADVDARVVLDPTLLFDGEWWSNCVRPVNINKPYILCYLFNENKSTYDFIERMKKKTGYDVVTLPFALSDIYQKNTKIYDAGPAEFLYLIKNASLIITDSFHATAFSINFNKNFVCLFRNTDGEKNNMNSRITSILSIANLEDRIITNLDSVNEVPTEIDYTEPNRRIDERRKRDKDFLLKLLQGGIND